MDQKWTTPGYWNASAWLHVSAASVSSKSSAGQESNGVSLICPSVAALPVLGMGLLLVPLWPRSAYSISYKSCLICWVRLMDQTMRQVLCIKHIMSPSHKPMKIRLWSVESFAQGHHVGTPVEPGLEPMLVWLQSHVLSLSISLPVLSLFSLNRVLA